MKVEYVGIKRGARKKLSTTCLKDVVTQADLLDRARDIARNMTQMSAPVSISLTRQMLWRMLGADHPMAAHRVDSRAVFGRGRQSDAKEGINSFLEKRPPAFGDRPSTDMPEFYPWWEEPGFKK